MERPDVTGGAMMPMAPAKPGAFQDEAGEYAEHEADKTRAPSLAEKAVRKSEVSGEKGGAPAEFERKIIYTGWFTVDVYDIAETQKKLLESVTAFGGYLQTQSGNQLVLRIPADKFDAIEPLLRKLGRVDENLTRIQAQDVTEEYYDVELRIRTKRKYLESLHKLLTTSGKLVETLAVQKEIARVVEDIERLEGRLRFLASQVSMSTVTVTFRLAHSGSDRTFRLPWDWLDELGLDRLLP